jgi:hypothetical protein
MLINSTDAGSGTKSALAALKRFVSRRDSPRLGCLLTYNAQDYPGLSVLVFAVTFLILFFNLGGNEPPWSTQ